MTSIPAEWQALFSTPALTGQGVLSIIGRTSSGPGVFAWTPGQTSAVPLVYYTIEQPLANPESANTLYTRADQLGGVAFPTGTRSVLFFGRHGMGTPGYGQARCGFQGECSDPYRGQVWAYDANDLLKVKNGQLQPWAVRPYAVWELPGNVGQMGSIKRGGAVYDPSTRRLYVTGDYGEQPRVHVYEIAVGTTTPPPVNCVVSSFGPWLPLGEWSACVAGQQSRPEQHMRTVVTPASNGGQACPVLVETRTETQPCTVTPPPVTSIVVKGTLMIDPIQVGPGAYYIVVKTDLGAWAGQLPGALIPGAARPLKAGDFVNIEAILNPVVK
jgi:hypothetical protein